MLGFLIFDSPRSFLVARVDRQFVAFGVEIMVDLFDRHFVQVTLLVRLGGTIAELVSCCSGFQKWLC